MPTLVVPERPLDEQLYLTRNALRRYATSHEDSELGRLTAAGVLRRIRDTGVYTDERPEYVPQLTEPVGYVIFSDGCFPVTYRRGTDRHLVAVSYFSKIPSPRTMTSAQLAEQVHFTQHALQRYCERYRDTTLDRAEAELKQMTRESGVVRTTPPWVLGFDRDQLFVVIDDRIALPLVRAADTRNSDGRHWVATTCIPSSLMEHDFRDMSGRDLAERIALTRKCITRFKERADSRATLTHDIIQEALESIRDHGRWSPDPPDWLNDDEPASGGYVTAGEVCFTLVRAELSHANGRGAHNRPLIAVTCKTPQSEAESDDEPEVQLRAAA